MRTSRSCRSSASTTPSSASARRSTPARARRWPRRWSRDVLARCAAPSGSTRSSSSPASRGAEALAARLRRRGRSPDRRARASRRRARGIDWALRARLRARAARARRLPGARPARGRRAARRRRRARRTSSIVPDRHGTGTNALLLAPPDAIAPELRPGQPRAPRGRRAARPARPWRVAEPRSLRARRRHRRATSRRCAPRSPRARGGAAHTRGAARRGCAPAAEPPRRRCALRGPARGRARATTSPRCSPRRAAATLRDGDVLVVAHKVVSKAEGARASARRRRRRPTRARELAARARQGPARTCRSCSTSPPSVLRAERGVLICRTRHGFVCANAGVDASNAPASRTRVVLLPARPRRLGPRAARRASCPERARGRRSPTPSAAPGATASATWRSACAGLAPLDDWRGRRDARRPRAARDLDRGRRRGRGRRRPRARQGLARAGGVVRGLGPPRHRTDDGPGAAALVRPPAEDLFG